MREPKKRGLSMNDLAPIMKVFDDLENNEIEDFCNDFRGMFGELAKDLMEMVEGEIVKRVEWHLEYRRQKEICFFSPENEQKIREQIKESIWKEIVKDLEDYGF